MFEPGMGESCEGMATVTMTRSGEPPGLGCAALPKTDPIAPTGDPDAVSTEGLAGAGPGQVSRNGRRRHPVAYERDHPHSFGSDVTERGGRAVFPSRRVRVGDRSGGRGSGPLVTVGRTGSDGVAGAECVRRHVGA
ncbi:hypothetical protein GCM10023175_03390 [Pseudonocardia xishanensis]|uniref:Uncharacterized protein n=1 Tax=Pseudonocardia xishanensis TaxID=630995 RepID=A0ABP8RE99_9PSEU